MRGQQVLDQCKSCAVVSYTKSVTIPQPRCAVDKKYSCHLKISLLAKYLSLYLQYNA